MAKPKGKGKKASTKARNLPAKTLSSGKAADVKGGFLKFTFKTVSVKTVGWSHDDDPPPQKN
jgi:hypothetical protein